MANNRKNKIIDSKENYLLVYPNQVKEDINRAVNTMGFIDKETPDSDNLDAINDKLDKANKEIRELEDKIQAIKNENSNLIEDIPYSIEYYEKSAQIKDKMAKGDKYFYLSGWVPKSKVDDFKKLEDKYEKLR